MTTVTRTIRFAVKARHKRAVVGQTGRGDGRPGTDADFGPEATDAAVGRVPRVARLMALAIKYDGLLRRGEVADQSELARLCRVTQPRMTQIMNLLHLAPDIQEEILFLPEVTAGRDPVTERDVRGMTLLASWRRQRALWRDCHSLTPSF